MDGLSVHLGKLRKVSILLNGIVLIFSLGLFAYTFFAKDHLVAHTREFVSEKTLAHSRPLLEVAKSNLDSPLVGLVMSKDQRALAEKELKEYETNPIQYIASLTSTHTEFSGTGAFAKIKEKIRSYFQSVFSELVRDLRIFSISNAVVSLLAILLLATRNRRSEKNLAAFSIILFVAVVSSTLSYAEGKSFVRILLKWHPGWMYPVGILLTFVGLVRDLGLDKKTLISRSRP